MDDFTILCILAGIGVAWGATATYLIRVRDYALQTETAFRDRYSATDHAAELVIAGFAGFISAVAAHSSGLSPPVIVLSASAGSFLNRSAFQLLAKYAPLAAAGLAQKYIHHHESEITTGLDFQTHFAICNRLNGDWQQLADYYEIPQSHRAQWERGREPQRLLLWLANRDRMPQLAAGLRAIDRLDLADLLERGKNFD